MNSLVSLVRTIKRHKLIVVLNLLGLALGIACAYLAYKWAADELTFDSFHPDYEDIYLVQIIDKNLTASTTTPPPLAPALQEKYPEIIQQSRYVYHSGGELLEYASKKTYAKGIEVDASFFNMFHFPLAQGDKKNMFKEPNSIIISKDLALKLFGSENAIGKTVNFKNQHLLTVKGILATIPQNSSIAFDYAVPYTTFYKPEGDVWGMWHPASFIKLSPKADASQIAQKIRKFANIHERKERELSLFALQDIHFKLEDQAFFRNYTSYVHLQAMLLMSLFILSVSCLNYINLSVALFSTRAKEVGIKKVLGADQPLLTVEYLKEVFIQGGMAIVLAFILLLSADKYLAAFTGKDILSFVNSKDVLIFLAAGCLISFLSGIYPALFLSSYPPLGLIRRFTRPAKKGFAFRNVLIVGQFAVTIIILLSSIILSGQIRYIQNKDLGYNKHQLLAIPMDRGNVGEKQAVIKQELAAIPGVKKVSTGSFRYMYFDEKVSEWEGKQDDNTLKLYAMGTDYDFDQTMGLALLDGRFFSRAFNDEANLVINNEAARQMGMEKPVGKSVKWRNKTYTIIGVIQDFNYRDLSKKVDPVFLFQASYGDVFVRIQDANTAQTLGEIANIFKKYNAAFPFEYHFVDQEVAHFYEKESRMENILYSLTGICIFLSGLGLYALSSFVIGEKTKEISIKKILGASLYRLFGELSLPFLRWIVLASLIAIPAGIWVMNQWLNSYAYHRNIKGIDIFVTVLITILVALSALVGNVVKASMKNPLHAIRVE